jgi:8-hydroxy-5-deazaflavin:NADPH oxidoreductase
MIQNMLPDSYVVKAFNTLGVNTMNDPSIAGGPVTIPYAGNDADAKAVVHELIELIGMQAVDVGSVRFAYVLEGMLALWANGNQMGRPFDYHFQLYNR